MNELVPPWPMLKLPVFCGEMLVWRTQCGFWRTATNGGTIGDRMVKELAAIVDELGGERVVGHRVRTGEEMSRAIREGFPHSVVDCFVRNSGLSLQEVARSLDLSVRSLQRRKHTGRLARFESDRLFRLARLFALAEHFLGDRDRGVAWLKRPNRALGGAIPLEIIDTESGARQVEEVLGRIGYGGVS